MIHDLQDHRLKLTFLLMLLLFVIGVALGFNAGVAYATTDPGAIPI